MGEQRFRFFRYPRWARSVAAGAPTAVRRAAVVALLVVLMGAAGARAKTFVVDTFANDGGDVVNGDGFCALIAHIGCTLRGAVQEANAWPGRDVILVPTALINLTLQGSDDTAVRGDLDILDDVEIDGAGMGRTVVNGTSLADRLFDVLPGKEATISGVTLEGGTASSGGAIEVEMGATLSLRYSELYANSSSYGPGALESFGTTTVYGSYLHQNVAAPTSGVFFGAASAVGTYDPGSMRIERSTISDNSCGSCSSGSPAAVVANSYLEVIDSTISNNWTGTFGVPADGIESNRGLVVQNSTISSNTGRGIVYSNQTFLLINSIVADNDLGDCALSSGYFVTRYSLDSDGSCALSAATGSLPNTDPVLGSLSDYGGPAPTLMPLPGSPAIDSGSDAPGDCASVDERGLARPWDGDMTGGAVCDMGAVEVGPIRVFQDDFESGDTGAWSATLP